MKGYRMKVTPITNNNYPNNNPSCKGYVSNNVTWGLNAYCRKYNRYIELAKTNPYKYSALIDYWENAAENISKYTDNIIQNMKTIMLRFGKSCMLEWHDSKKDPLKQIFTIESDDSDYIHVCGDVQLENIPYSDLTIVDKFSTGTLAKINPYETNLKFRTMRNHDTYADTFAPEKNFWFVEDKLVDAKKGVFKNIELTNEKITEIAGLKPLKDKFFNEFCNYTRN